MSVTFVSLPNHHPLRELFETLLTPKPQRQEAGHVVDHSQLADLLVVKDRELKCWMKEAGEQEEIQRKCDVLKGEVEKLDEHLLLLQKHLKDAEHILATAIYQAKQKLTLINRANERPLSSEEVIKYAHRISSSHAIAAPHNWEQGDPRRPYPTDVEMRSGHLGQINNDPSHPSPHASPQHQSQNQNQNPPHQSPFHAPPSVPGLDPTRPSSTSSNSNFSWQQDVKPNINSLNLPAPDPRSGSRDNLEDVEVMSTDSSSSSSSDSQ